MDNLLEELPNLDLFHFGRSNDDWRTLNCQLFVSERFSYRKCFVSDIESYLYKYAKSDITFCIWHVTFCTWYVTFCTYTSLFAHDTSLFARFFHQYSRYTLIVSNCTQKWQLTKIYKCICQSEAYKQLKSSVELSETRNINVNKNVNNNLWI